MKKIIALFLSVVLMLSVLSFYSYAEEKIDYVQNVSTLDISLLSDSPLLYSTVYYEWDSSMLNYNCYAFAIDRTSEWIHIGDESGLGYDHLADISTLATVVKADLAAYGYECTSIGNVRPSSRGNWQNVIALRKETLYTPDSVSNEENDFHFAMLNEDGEWLHKPGGTAVLKFNSSPSNSIAWICEGYYEDLTGWGHYFSENTIYDSNIKYLSYKTNHNFSAYIWSGDHYHSGRTHYYRYESVCADCSEVKSEWRTSPCLGPPCNTPWSITPKVEIN